jgi:hypothetical protein
VRPLSLRSRGPRSTLDEAAVAVHPIEGLVDLVVAWIAGPAVVAERHGARVSCRARRRAAPAGGPEAARADSTVAGEAPGAAAA